MSLNRQNVFSFNSEGINIATSNVLDFNFLLLGGSK